jgi:CRP/FNR family transcriptional regulator, cyclic AMP receptor protein
MAAMHTPLSIELSIISRISLFAGLSEAELGLVMASMERRSFRSREVIYHKHDMPGGLFIVLKGEAKTRIVFPDDRQITFHIFGAGSYFGMHSLLAEEARSTDAVAVTACDTLFFPRDHFLAFLRRYPEATQELLRVMARMYRSATQRMQDLALLDVRTRIAKELVHLAGGSARPAPHTEVCLNISQNELASLVGATRESTNKWLRFFENEGWIQLGRGNIQVLEVAKLEERTDTF